MFWNVVPPAFAGSGGYRSGDTEKQVTILWQACSANGGRRGAFCSSYRPGGMDGSDHRADMAEGQPIPACLRCKSDATSAVNQQCTTTLKKPSGLLAVNCTPRPPLCTMPIPGSKHAARDLIGFTSNLAVRVL